MSNIRLCRDSDRQAILAIINASSASAYRGVIPATDGHEPYMAADELDNENCRGRYLLGVMSKTSALVGVMGLQSVRDVDLIRHRLRLAGEPTSRCRRCASVACPGAGVHKRMLVGTWASAEWAIRFYTQHGFTVVSPARKDALLKYWNIPDRQIEGLGRAGRWFRTRKPKGRRSTYLTALCRAG